MPTLNAFASNKYRAIYVPTSLVFDLTYIFSAVGQFLVPICIDYRQDQARARCCTSKTGAIIERLLAWEFLR